MYTKIFTVVLLSSTTLAMQGFVNHPSFGVMLKRGSAIAKRQGYYPESDPCTGDGTTCAEVCGAEYVLCPSNDSLVLSCHSTLDGSHCCPDNTGSELPSLCLNGLNLILCSDACGPGDYCTSDTAGATYCCPEDIDPAECAIEFGVSTLIRQSTTVELPTTTASSDLPAETPVETLTETETDTDSLTTSSDIPAETPLASFTITDIIFVSASSVSSIVSTTSLPNATFSSPSTPEFTGGAAKVAGAGMAMLAGAAGFAFF